MYKAYACDDRVKNREENMPGIRENSHIVSIAHVMLI